MSQYTLNNLQKSYAQLDQGTVEQIVDILLRSDRKYIAGFRGTACCAQYMASKLLFLTPCGAHPPRGRHGGGKPVGHHGAGLPVPVQLSPVLRDRPALMEIARESGAKVILMTDRRTSPLANKADVVVTAQVDGLGFTNSYVAPLSLSEVILLSVSGRRM